MTDSHFIFFKVKANRDTYRAALVACGKLGDAETAKALFARAITSGKPELQACNAALMALHAAGDSEGKKGIIAAMEKHGVRSDAITAKFV